MYEHHNLKSQINWAKVVSISSAFSWQAGLASHSADPWLALLPLVPSSCTASQFHRSALSMCQGWLRVHDTWGTTVRHMWWWATALRECSLGKMHREKNLGECICSPLGLAQTHTCSHTYMQTSLVIWLITCKYLPTKHAGLPFITHSSMYYLC